MIDGLPRPADLIASASVASMVAMWRWPGSEAFWITATGVLAGTVAANAGFGPRMRRDPGTAAWRLVPTDGVTMRLVGSR